MNHNEYRKLFEADEQEAQRQVFREYFGYVYTVVHSKLAGTGSREDIEDCISDVFAEVFSDYSLKNASDGDLKGFIGIIAARKAVNYFKKNMSSAGKTADVDEEYLSSIPSDENIADEAEKKDLRRIILKKIKELGEPDSTIIMNKYYFGRTSGEIAEIVSLSPSLVRMKSMRALKKLKKLLLEAGIGGAFNE